MPDIARLPFLTIGSDKIPNFLALPARTVIGGITVQTSLEQEHTDRTTITRHPVQAGADITDHNYLEQARLVLRCGWSNSDLAAAQSIVAGFFSGGSAAGTYVDGIYSQLLALRETRQPFNVTTIRRRYKNMLFTSISVQTDSTTAQALMLEAELEQIIIVNTSTTILAPQQNHATPESTAEVVKGGALSLLPGTPNPGGSLPPGRWSVVTATVGGVTVGSGIP